MKKVTIVICFAIAIFSICFFFSNANAASKIKVTSSNFDNKEIIPDTHACNILGEDKSPELSFSNAPSGTQSFALILDDPDAPGGAFVHWIIYNIPGSASGLDEGLPRDNNLVNGAKQGANGTSGIGYFGPCPPPKETHRYVFKVFALDTLLDLQSGATKKQLIKTMRGHIIGRGKLVGLYKNNTNL